MSLNKVVEFLNANPVQYLATVGRDGKAKCRPFMFAGELDGKLWFCTNNTKDVYKDMQSNPEIEISVSSPEYAWIRLHGKAVFENNMAAKEMCIQNRSSRASTARRPTRSLRCSISRMQHGSIADFSGNPPYQFYSCRETTVSPTRGTDRGPLQSRPKVPIQKLSPSISKKTEAHVHGFLAFAEQMLLNMRCGARV